MQFEHLPMFLVGYKEIISRSSSDSYLVKENSHIDRSSSKLYWDIPLTSYEFEPDLEEVFDLKIDSNKIDKKNREYFESCDQGVDSIK